MNKEHYWLWMTTIKGIGNKKIQKLIDHFKKPEIAFEASKKEVLQFMKYNTSFRKQDIDAFLVSRKKESIEHDYQSIKALGINLVTMEDSHYPKELKNIFDPPVLLYYKGTLPKNNRMKIGIVGSRNCSEYGKKITMALAKELSDEGICIISGMARGIDTFAHLGALEGKSDTMAVLGSGVMVCYPRENEKLMQRIIEKGCVVSEVPIYGKPLAGNFPMRNRIISGMCNGIIVVEAKHQSGSLITANFALEQGKDVFVIPGRITDINSKGTNALLKVGAIPVTCVEDILDEYGLKRSGKRENLKVSLNKNERILFDLIEDAMTIDTILKRSGKSIGMVQYLLLQLELKGYIKKTANSQYYKEELE